MLKIIQGARVPWSATVFKTDAAGVRSFQDLTGFTEILACFKTGVNILTKTQTLAEITVDAILEGKISGFIEVVDSNAMPVSTEGSLEIHVDFGGGNVKKAIILNSHEVIEKICAV